MQARWNGTPVKYTPVSNFTLPKYPSGTLSTQEVRDAIQRAANVWNNANCCTQSVVNPQIRLELDTRPMDVPTKAEIFSGNVFRNPLPADQRGPGGKHAFFATTDATYPTEWGFNSTYPGTLGITYLWMTDAGAIDNIDSAMIVFNGFGEEPFLDSRGPGAPYKHRIFWYTGATTQGGSTAFNLETVAIHELGHFLGYLHSDCAGTVMVAQYAANRQQLAASDVRTICASVAERGYGRPTCPTPTPQEQEEEQEENNPVTNGGGTVGPTASMTKPGADRYYFCNTSADCANSLVCRTFPNGQKVCDYACATTAACPVGEVCSSSGYCRAPLISSGEGTTGGGGTSGGTTGTSGTTTTPVDPAEFVPIQDFCAPCTSRSDCANSLCVRLSEDSTPICSAWCSSDAECGTLGTCTATGGGSSNGVCIPRDTSCIQKALTRAGQLNEACTQEEPCGPGLSCIQLDNSAVCLETCDSTGAQPCKTDGYACYEIDAEAKKGVCFKATAREGESCLLPDTSLCGFAGQLTCLGTPAKQYQDAACYKLCGGTYGGCQNGQTCATNPGATIGACTPLLAATCELADFGEACSKADDCATGYCVNSGAESACSRSCNLQTQTGCPVSFTCRSSGGANGYCWPSDNIVKPGPVCTRDTKAPGECGCKGSPGDFSLIALVAMMLFLARRRRI
jgi:hypothetical protein